MTDTHTLAERLENDTADPSLATRRFRGETFDAALAAAHTELGPGVQVIAANRIRRGGLGGFFATDLGVEVTVTTNGSAEPAIDRFDPQVALDERAAFEQRMSLDQMIDSMPGTTTTSPAVATQPDRPRPSELADVFELTHEGMGALLAEIADASDIARAPGTSTFEQHLASADATTWPGDAPSGGIADTTHLAKDFSMLSWPDDPAPPAAAIESAAVESAAIESAPIRMPAAPTQPEVEWARDLRLDHEAFCRADARPDPLTVVAMAEERAAQQTVRARRILVSKEVGSRPPGGMLDQPRPVASSSATVLEPATPPGDAPIGRSGLDDSTLADLADLDELLRSVGVEVVAAPDRALPTTTHAAPTDPVIAHSNVEQHEQVHMAITTPDGLVVEMSARVDGSDG